MQTFRYKTYWQCSSSEDYISGENIHASEEHAEISLQEFLKHLLKRCSTDEEYERILMGDFIITENDKIVNEIEGEFILHDIDIDLELVTKLGFQKYPGSEIVFSDFTAEMIYKGEFKFEFKQADQERFVKQLIRDGIISKGVKAEQLEFSYFYTLTDEDKERFKKVI